MSAFWGELLGTALLMFMGSSVVANSSLNKTKGKNAGLLVITLGWAIAVAIPIFIFNPICGAHFNPAVTLGKAVIGAFPWQMVPAYIVAQLIGAILGTTLMYIHFLPHWKETHDKEAKFSCFSTSPAIRSTGSNFISEFLATFVLLFMLLGIDNTEIPAFLSPIVVGLVILLIGMTLGGTTGYAINPARDLGPRIAHTFLPIPDKGSSHWEYAWIPVLGPICGGITGAVVYSLIF